MTNELIRQPQLPLSEIMSMGKAFQESGMFPDIKSAAQAMVKIQAGQELGIAPFAAMTGIHIIQGRPTVGAGVIASKVKGSGKYDYKVKELTDKACVISFMEGEKFLGESSFTIEDAKKARTQNLEKFSRNMLFARAISNGVKWFCPDVFNGPVYDPEEMEQVTEDAPAASYSVEKPSLNQGSEQWKEAIKYLPNGGTIDKIEAKYQLTGDSRELLISESMSGDPDTEAKKIEIMNQLKACKTIEEVDALGKERREEVLSLGIRDEFLKFRINLKRTAQTKQTA